MTIDKTKAAQIARLDESRRIGEKLVALLDPDVQGAFNDLERALIDALGAAVRAGPAQTHILACRLAAFREVRSFIEAAVHSRAALTERINKLTKVETTDAA